MVPAYLWLLTLVYALFAVWTALRPDATATFLGLRFSEGAGRIEYVTVYGGLEAALAIVFALAALGRVPPASILAFSAILHGCLAGFRLAATIGYGGPGPATWGAMGLELAFALLAVWLWTRVG